MQVTMTSVCPWCLAVSCKDNSDLTYFSPIAHQILTLAPLSLGGEDMIEMSYVRVNMP